MYWTSNFLMDFAFYLLPLICTIILLFIFASIPSLIGAFFLPVLILFLFYICAMISFDHSFTLLFSNPRTFAAFAIFCYGFIPVGLFFFLWWLRTQISGKTLIVAFLWEQISCHSKQTNESHHHLLLFIPCVVIFASYSSFILFSFLNFFHF